MIYIGCHLSTADGYAAMGKAITAMGGNTFAWFTRNPRGRRSTPPAAEDEAMLLDYSMKDFLILATITISCTEKMMTNTLLMHGIWQRNIMEW